MKRLLVTTLTALALTLLALARWLDGGHPPTSGRNRSAKSIDLPRSHYHFRHAPPTRWQITVTGLAILFSSLRFAVSPIPAGGSA